MAIMAEVPTINQKSGIGGTDPTETLVKFRTDKALKRNKINKAKVIVAQGSVQRCIATLNFFVTERQFFPVTVNNETLHSQFMKVAGEMVGPGNVRDRIPVMGAEDFAFFSEIVPSTYYYFLGMQTVHASLAHQYLLEAADSAVKSPSESHSSSHDEL